MCEQKEKEGEEKEEEGGPPEKEKGTHLRWTHSVEFRIILRLTHARASCTQREHSESGSQGWLDARWKEAACARVQKETKEERCRTKHPLVFCSSSSSSRVNVRSSHPLVVVQCTLHPATEHTLICAGVTLLVPRARALPTSRPACVCARPPERLTDAGGRARDSRRRHHLQER